MNRLTCLIVSCVIAMNVRAASYYVSPTGSDANAGTQTSPWKSLSKVSGTTFQPGDSVLFQAGGSWSGGITLHGSGVNGSPIKIDQYGSGNKPLLQGAGAVNAVIDASNSSYWEINNLELTNTGNGSAAHYGIYGHYTSGTRLNHLYLSNIDIHNVDCPNNFGAGGICINEIISDLQVTNCTVHDTGGQGIFFGDDYAWVVPKVQATYDTYAATDVVVSNCTVYNCADSGIEIWGVKRPVIQYCTSHDCNFGTNTAYVGIWIMDCENGILQYNNSYHHHGGIDGECFDVDVLCFNTIVQYNYAHDNDYVGIIAYGYTQNGNPLPTNGAVFRYNVVQNCAGGSFGLAGDQLSNTQWYNNSSFASAQGKQVTGGPYNGTVGNSHSFTNNIFYQGGFSFSTFAAGAVTFNTNCYYNNSTALPTDARAILANPLFVSPGSGGSTLTSVDGYKLQAGSPCINAGATIAGNGGKDYWGNPVPNGATDIGANEFTGSTTPVLSSITVSPGTVTVAPNAQQQFTATGLDQSGNAINPQPTFIWSATGGGTFSTGLLLNGGFESGSASWTTYNTPAALTSSNTHIGGQAIALNANSGFFQIVNNLTPGTYVLTGWAKVQNAGDTVFLGIKNYGGAEVSVPITSTSYTQAAVSFTVPAGNTSGMVYLWMNAASGQAYGDDIDLQTNGLFLANAAGGGPFTISASSAGIVGNATVNPVVVTESPYGGTRWPIPGTIEAENYDNGGEGVAYHDTSAGNTGGGYRNDDVDIRGGVDGGGDYQVGWTDTGEWLKYSVNISSSGSYALTERVAAGASGGALHIEMDGANITGSISVPNTGGWDTWQSLTQTVSLTAGSHIMRVYIEAPGFDMNWFSFSIPNAAPVITSVASASPASAVVGQSIGFAVGASDPDGDAVAYAWNFGDGATGSGATPSHAYSAAGTFTATATASDSAGNSVSSAVVVTISNVVQNSVHVGGLTLTLSSSNKGKAAVATVLVKDGNGAVVSGATVSGAWSGLTSGTASGTTGSNGTVKFTSQRTKQSGTFTFSISTVSAPGYVYASGQNATNGGTITTSGQVTIAAAAPIAADATASAAVTPTDLGVVSTASAVSVNLVMPDALAQAVKVRATSKDLPPGLRLSGGVVSGLPKLAGTYTINVAFVAKMVNVNASGKKVASVVHATQQYTITVTP
jgi:hypothetical protein